MTDIILCGCQGHMGKTITELVNERSDLRITAGVDLKNDLTAEYPIYSDISDVREHADVIVDFSHPSLLNGILSFAKSKNKPTVIATTGNSEEDIQKIKIASENCPIFFSYNMSLGISLITELAVMAKKILGDGFDIEIIEKHHNKKIDAPSGTAIMLADAINNDGKYSYIYDRHQQKRPRDKNEIGISSVRGGSIVGEHSVLFAGIDELIEIKHTAYSKKIFAAGALNAAKWLTRQPNGLYSMKDIV
mgnify:CR=1 FL=1